MKEDDRFLARFAQAQVGHGHVVPAAPEAHLNSARVLAGGQLVAQRPVQHGLKKVPVGLSGPHQEGGPAHRGRGYFGHRAQQAAQAGREDIGVLSFEC